MTVNWIEPIYDRTAADVANAEGNPTGVNLKGCYNAEDLNRIENNTKYVAEDMLARKIIRVPATITTKLDWNKSEIPTREDMTRIIENIKLLMSLSNQEIANKFRTIYASSQVSFSLANALEYNLEVMKNQPELPIKSWLLTVEQGYITNSQGMSNTSLYVAEDEIVTITGEYRGADEEYMRFTRWSGNSDDLQYVGDVNSRITTYTMQYHDYEDYSVTIRAEFKTSIPRKLKLHGATIKEGPLAGATEGMFLAGDEILLLADLAPSGKRFYTFEGTPEALENLISGPEPSTSWLVMPDCNVELTSKYINAGQHKIVVDNQIQGWYNYGDYVSLFAEPPNPPEKYAFDYWSGDTAYLDDITLGTLVMPDVNLYFTSHWKYIYSYNTIKMINGTINDLAQQSNLLEGSSHPIKADTAPAGKEFDYWSIVGPGTFLNEKNANTLFTIGDGDAVITANFRDILPRHTITVENAKNDGKIVTKTLIKGDEYSIVASEILPDYMFDYWEKNGVRFKNTYEVKELIVGDEDITYKAIFRPREIHDVTVVNGSGSGKYKERQRVNIKPNDAEIGKFWDRWNYVDSGRFHYIDYMFDESPYIEMGRENVTIEATFLGGHQLTIINGSGSGIYKVDSYATCRADQAPNTYEFASWTNEADEIVSYSNPYNCLMDSDKTLTANYKPIPWFDVTIINGELDSKGSGKTTGTYLRNSHPTIVMNPAPEGFQFLQWEVVEGPKDAVYQPLAENTTLANLLANTIVKATYYVPDPETKYVLTIIGKTGEVTTYNNSVGEQIEIWADYPDEGYMFYMWSGDNQYLADKYSDKTVVTMPARNIELHMEYRREGFETLYHVEISGGQLQIKSDDYERWTTEGEFVEGTKINIRADEIPLGWRFNSWTDDDGVSATTVNDLKSEETFLTVGKFDIYLHGEIIEKDNYKLQITNPIDASSDSVSGSYHEDMPVAVYFDLPLLEGVKYTFKNWSGSDVSTLTLFDGGAFDAKIGGTADNPQVIRMPARNISLTGEYDTAYKVTITNGTIGGASFGYYKVGEVVKLKADTIDKKIFKCWSGDTEFLDSIYNPEASVTIPSKTIKLEATYVDTTKRNDTGLISGSAYDRTEIQKSEVLLFSGEIRKGLLLFDEKGHMYIVTNITNETLTITRLTIKEDNDGK